MRGGKKLGKRPAPNSKASDLLMAGGKALRRGDVIWWISSPAIWQRVWHCVEEGGMINTFFEGGLGFLCSPLIVPFFCLICKPDDTDFWVHRRKDAAVALWQRLGPVQVVTIKKSTYYFMFLSPQLALFWWEWGRRSTICVRGLVLRDQEHCQQVESVLLESLGFVPSWSKTDESMAW